MRKEFKTERSGFTLVEMLIVVGVLAMLLGLLAPAIIKNVKIAQKKKNVNERAVLQAAIVEFWHDQKKWPIKAGETPKKVDDYKLSYAEDNYEVFNQLIKADFGGQKKIKNYIDPTRHITPVGETALSLQDVVIDQSGNASELKTPLVYWSEFSSGSSEALTRGLRPYVVTFDMMNNLVTVTEK